MHQLLSTSTVRANPDLDDPILPHITPSEPPDLDATLEAKGIKRTNTAMVSQQFWEWDEKYAIPPFRTPDSQQLLIPRSVAKMS